MKKFRVALTIVLIFGMSGIVYAQGPGMGGGKKSSTEAVGAKLFNVNCARCHPNGGNVILADLPLRGSSKLIDFKTFLSFIRDPKMPDGSEGVMPVFSDKQISDKQAKTLYQYIVSAGTGGTLGRGYGMGPGMMGGGMMGGGMMAGYYQSEECQKFLDETTSLRKELYNKRFEYSEAYRNPKTSPETLVKLEREILDLQKKIYAKAPLGCGW